MERTGSSNERVDRMEMVDRAFAFLHRLGLISVGKYQGFGMTFAHGDNPADFLPPMSFSKLYVDFLAKIGEQMEGQDLDARNQVLQAALVLTSTRNLPEGRTLPPLIKKTPTEVMRILIGHFDAESILSQGPTPVQEIAAGVRRRTRPASAPDRMKLQSVGWEYLDKLFKKNGVYMSKNKSLGDWMEEYDGLYKRFSILDEQINRLNKVVYRGNVDHLMRKATRAKLTPVVVAYPDTMRGDYQKQLAYAGRLMGHYVDIILRRPKPHPDEQTVAEKLTARDFRNIRSPQKDTSCSQELFFIDRNEIFDHRTRPVLDQNLVTLQQLLVIRALTSQVDMGLSILTADRTVDGNRVAMTNDYPRTDVIINEVGSIFSPNTRERVVY